MAKSIGDALRLFNHFDNFDLVNIDMESNETTVHDIKHKYREKIIVPLLAISDNIKFFLSKGDKYVNTSDHIKCKVEKWDEKNICELEDDIMAIYGIDAFSWLKSWYKYLKCIDSMSMIVMELKKV